MESEPPRKANHLSRLPDGKRTTTESGVRRVDAAAAKKAKTSTLSTEQQSFVSLFKPAPVCVCCVCVCVQCDMSMYLRLSIYLPMYLSRCIFLYVPSPCRARGACGGVYHVCVCVRMCFFVSFNCFALVLSLYCSTGVESLLLDRCSRRSTRE